MNQAGWRDLLGATIGRRDFSLRVLTHPTPHRSGDALHGPVALLEDIVEIHALAGRDDLAGVTGEPCPSCLPSPLGGSRSYRHSRQNPTRRDALFIAHTEVASRVTVVSLSSIA